MLFVAIPFLAYAGIEKEYSMRVFIRFSVIAAGVLAGLIVIHRFKWTSFVTLPVILLVSFYYLSLYVLIGYYAVMRNYFDPTFLDFGADIGALVDLIGLGKTIVVIGGCILFFWFVLHMLKVQLSYLDTATKKWGWKRLSALSILSVISVTQASGVYGYYVQQAQPEVHSFIIAPKEKDIRIKSDDNVIILQLESTNAMALTGRLEFEGKKYDGFYMPHMASIGQNGTFFPLFFGNQQQTVRAQEAIICGVPGNTGKRLSTRTKEIPVDCLPTILHENGYDTIFMKSAKNPTFMQTDKLVDAAGFTEQHFGDMMKPGDTNWGWGYNDCDFYKRSFDFLKEKHADKTKKFVYMEVGSNHANFAPKPGYDFVSDLDPSENYLARYIHSAMQQDYCLSDFYTNFQSYAPENTHLFIVGDHPWGLQEGWAKYNGQAENFFVPMVYVPPRNRSGEFEVGKTITDYYYSQSDMKPTILELLGAKNEQNSFVFALRKPAIIAGLFSHLAAPNYERCQVLHSLYDGGATAVVRGMEKYTYVHREKTVYYADLREDLLEKDRKKIGKGVDFATFVQKYSCDRFRVLNGK